MVEHGKDRPIGNIGNKIPHHKRKTGMVKLQDIQ